MSHGALPCRAVDSPLLVAALVAIGLYALFVAGLALAGRGPEARALARLVPDCLVLARGLLGDQKGTPKVACPQHKKTFSLKSGECLSGDPLKIRTFPVRIEDGFVLVELPSPRDVDKLVPIKISELACQPGAE